MLFRLPPHWEVQSLACCLIFMRLFQDIGQRVRVLAFPHRLTVIILTHI